MERHLLGLRLAIKNLQTNARRCTKQEADELAKAQRAADKQRHEMARIHNENALRKRTESNHNLELAARIDGVASRLQSTLVMRRFAHSMIPFVNKMAFPTDADRLSILVDQIEKMLESRSDGG